MLEQRWFAAVYGWTPDQVGEVPLDYLPWYPLIEDAERWADQRRAKAEAARERRQRTGR